MASSFFSKFKPLKKKDFPDLKWSNFLLIVTHILLHFHPFLSYFLTKFKPSVFVKC